VYVVVVEPEVPDAVFDETTAHAQNVRLVSLEDLAHQTGRSVLVLKGA
jgi:hypothetical protein